MTISEFLVKTTIRIESKTKEGIQTGTGFFFNFSIDSDHSIPSIITNKHVVEGVIQGNLEISVVRNNAEHQKHSRRSVIIDDFEKKWIPHPKVDLTILPIAHILNGLYEEGYVIENAFLSLNDLISEEECRELSLIENVTIVGYPDGIWDEVNNFPIVRKGITATPLQVDFNGNPEFLVDAAIYGGSSGSPIFIFNEGMYFSNNALIPGNRIKLVGIIYAVAQHKVNGEIRIVNAPVSKKQIAQTLIPNNLGVAIHARELRYFESMLLPFKKLSDLTSKSN